MHNFDKDRPQAADSETALKVSFLWNSSLNFEVKWKQITPIYLRAHEMHCVGEYEY